MTFLNCEIFAKKGENKQNQQKLHNSVLKLFPAGLATWHECFQSMGAPTQIWIGLDGQTGDQFDKTADF